MESERQPAPRTPRFFELIPPNLGIDYVRLAPTMIAVSLVAILIGLASIWWRGGLNYGIDFAGGTLVEVRLAKAASVADVRAALDREGLGAATVQEVGRDGTEFQIRARSYEAAGRSAADAVRAGLTAAVGEGAYEVLRADAVGPKVGQALWRDAGLAVLVATVMMGIYIALRFDLRFGICAAVALLHDVLVTVGALSLAALEFDLTTVAALLTVVGFSVNDTVVISDRIRENLRLRRKDDLGTIINASVNETLSRTIITSGTAIMVVIALFLLGGDVIHSFAFALLVGFVAGVYSSVYVAAPIVLWLERWGRRRPAPARAK